jgi:hypothetical protein
MKTFDRHYCRGEVYPRPKRAHLLLFAMIKCLFLILLCIGIIGCSDDSDSDVPVPKLTPITFQEARDFMAHARTMQTQTATGEPRPVAWSMANWCCEERAMAVEYAAAEAKIPFNEEPVILRETDITDAHVTELVENPGIDIATINITGPLIAEQTFVDPDGKPVAGDPWPLAWSYHHAAVVNVDGEFMVIDLSIGDEPLTIDDWAHSFIPEDVECHLMDEEDYQKVWSYWLSVFSNFELPRRPSRICGYTITPIFRYRWDQEPVVDQLRWTPSTLETQCDGFKNILADDYGFIIEDGQVPFFTSLYDAKPEEILCEWMDLSYCD